MTTFAIFCGSRSWEDHEPIKTKLSELPIDSTIIHGCAPGADSIAGYEASLIGLDVIEVPAPWKQLGSSAGPVRNGWMLQMLLVAKKLGQEVKVFAFHEDPGLGRGTRDMVRQARKSSIPVCIWVLP